MIRAGDKFDVFVFDRGSRRRGHMYKGIALWNGSTQLLPYGMNPDRGGFAIGTSQLELEGATVAGRKVHAYRRPAR